MDITDRIAEITQFLDQQEDHFVTVNGSRVRYIDVGSGPPVLLIHGLGGSLEVWGFNIIQLSQYFHIYALDLPGHGLSQMVKDCYTFACGMDVVTNILRELGLERTAIVGHSLGGIICLGVASRLPDTINKLVLVDSAGLSRYVPWSYRIASIPVLGNMITALISKVTGMSSRSLTRRLFYNEDLLPEEVIRWLGENRQVSWTRQDLLKILRLNVNLKGIRDDAGIPTDLRLLKMPVLVIHGTQDAIFPLKHVRKAAGLLPDARLLLFEECGHVPQIEKAEEFNERVISFLQKRQ